MQRCLERLWRQGIQTARVQNRELPGNLPKAGVCLGTEHSQCVKRRKHTWTRNERGLTGTAADGAGAMAGAC